MVTRRSRTLWKSFGPFCIMYFYYGSTYHSHHGNDCSTSLLQAYEKTPWKSCQWTYLSKHGNICSFNLHQFYVHNEINNIHKPQIGQSSRIKAVEICQSEMSLMCHQFEIHVLNVKCSQFWWLDELLLFCQWHHKANIIIIIQFTSFEFWWRFLIILFLLSSNFSGFALYLYGSYNIVSITSLLDVSIEWIFRRYWMLCSDLRTKHLEFYLPTPLLFHGHISIHLSLSWKFSSQI